MEKARNFPCPLNFATFKIRQPQNKFLLLTIFFLSLSSWSSTTFFLHCSVSWLGGEDGSDPGSICAMADENDKELNRC
ncbi:hypothetical protein K7X08_010276 [Anisodus acutangulus]|uniref:Uncharacterized protein n=1 Tax=Anisodus acutangulus TaxID=402998 RepID=A0A9Q1N1F5_9SOLA|nr:hypothetical protein K7X08_010276 [Anisodus acutangulus]